MTEKEIYIDIASRFIQSCLEQIENNIDFQEAIGFSTYHAFESIAGAYNCHLGHPVSRNHDRKISTFVFNYNRAPHARIKPETIAQIAIVLNSMRNKYLYPEPSAVGLKAPKDQMTLAQATQLTNRVYGVITKLISAM